MVIVLWCLLFFVPFIFSAGLEKELSSIDSDGINDDLVEFLRDCFDEGSNCSTRPSLKDSQNAIYEALLREYRTAASPGARHINFLLFNVIGWPNEVIFYSKSLWSKRDCSILTEAIGKNEIKFVRKSLPNTKIISARSKDALKAEILELSVSLFGCQQIQWQMIKLLCPELHLRFRKIEDFRAEDYENLMAAVKILKQELQKRRATQRTSIGKVL